MVKAYNLMLYTDPLRKEFGKLLSDIFYNQNLCTLFDENELGPLPENIAKQTPEEDHYLVQLYLASDADLLVTSDLKLHDALASVESIKVKLRDDFLQDYSSQ